MSLQSVVRSIISPTRFDTIAQISHVECGLVVVLIANRWGYQLAAAALIVYTAIKEFWYDAKYEPPDVQGSSLKDFCFQVGGAIAGLVLIHFKP